MIGDDVMRFLGIGNGVVRVGFLDIDINGFGGLEHVEFCVWIYWD